MCCGARPPRRLWRTALRCAMRSRRRLRRWRCEGIDYCLRILRRDQYVGNRTDNADVMRGIAFDADRIKPVLRPELFTRFRTPQRHADDTPVAFAGIHCGVGIHGLVRAMKGAEPEVDDSAGLFTRDIAGAPNPCREGINIREV